jgi:hypothetical protein
LRVILATLRRVGQRHGRGAVDDTRSNELGREVGQNLIRDFFMVLTERD